MILVATGLKREAAIVAGPGIVAVCGGGAAEALAARMAAQAAGSQAVLSFGLAGALAPDLRPGDILVGTSVTDGQETWPTDQAWSQALLSKLPRSRAAGLFGSQAMLLTRAAKAQALARTRAAAADMESHIAARLATRLGLPFAAIRAVSDAAERDLPSAVSVGLTPDGDMALVPVLKALARRPSELPALIRAGREAELGFRALADARHLLGPGIGRLDLGQLVLHMG